MADPYLFRPKPPDFGRRDLIKDLFVDREGDLDFARGLLQFPAPTNDVLAVHGPTRCGKSHLVLRLLEELSEAGFLQVRVNANDRKEAASILQSIFIELRNKL